MNFRKQFPNLFRWRWYLLPVIICVIAYLAVDWFGRWQWATFVRETEAKYNVQIRNPVEEGNIFLDEKFLEAIQIPEVNLTPTSDPPALVLKETAFIPKRIPIIEAALKEHNDAFRFMDSHNTAFQWHFFLALWNARCNSLHNTNQFDEIAKAFEICMDVSRLMMSNSGHSDFPLDWLWQGIKNRSWNVAQLIRFGEILDSIDLRECMVISAQRKYFFKIAEIDRTNPGEFKADETFRLYQTATKISSNSDLPELFEATKSVIIPYGMQLNGWRKKLKLHESKL